ncbi:BglG family transcription antiterminator [Bacillus salitolerans]|uniref:BglG family transcription antiterminator n=1 Tax=Bacillus salitolerans TaxID=1437434 RepID=A0ABW4LTL0_9BACI
MNVYISARERKILEFLLAKTDESTVKELAKALEVSPRTIHRDLKGVESTLHDYGLVLDKKAGIGIQITGHSERKEKLRLFLYNLSHIEYTPEERQAIIISELLDHTEPIKLLALANDLNVTIATVSNDLNKIEEQLHFFNLTLVRKRGYGVEIIGTESAKRKAMSKLISDHINEYEMISFIKENIQKKSTRTMDTITDKLLGLVDRKKLLIIEKKINEIREELPYSIADSSYIGLVVHLALAIERIQQGEDINFDEEQLKKLEHTKEYQVAEKMVNGLEDIFGINIAKGEIGFITMHLMGAKLRNEYDDMLEGSSLQVGMLVQHLIQFVSREIDHDLSKNMSLFQGLVTHLRPALYRLHQNMGISNPLLMRIKQDYNELFSILKKGVEEIFPDIHVPDEEIGYLVMHFASALLNREVGSEVRTLVVCSSGIGTSKILSSKLEQEIPGIKTINASLFDLVSINPKEFDLIVSTIPLKNFETDYLVVSPLLSREEIDNVKRVLLTKKHHSTFIVKKVISNKNYNDSKSFIESLSKVKNYSSAVFHVLNGFFIMNIEDPVSVVDALEQICFRLEEEGVISSTSEVVKELFKREQLGGLGIPGTVMALYHTRSGYIQLPSFTILRLNTPLTVKAMDESIIHITSILLMLAPNTCSSETLEVLSGISSLIMRDDKTIYKFQNDVEEDLAQLLSTEMKIFYDEKVKQ